MQIKLPAKFPFWIITAGAVGAMLIVFAPSLTSSEPVAAQVESEKTADQYKDKIEAELLELLSAIDGVSEISLMVTVESAGENVYATEKKSTINLLSDTLTTEEKRVENQNDNEDSYIIVTAPDGSEQPILLKELEPVVNGVAIVCRGAQDDTIRQKLIETTAVALNLPTNRVSVVAK